MSADSDTTVPTADAIDVAATLDLALAETARSLSCPGGPGCFCTSHEECSTGVCADDAGSPTSKACAYPFGNGCAAGYVTLTAVVGEGATVCVPAAAKLCNPCEKDENCQATGATGALCVDRGANGRFCGIACPNLGCPAGYLCADAVSSSGAKGKQCVPKGGANCPCSPAAIAQKLTTVCKVVNTVGVCGGQRSCEKDGLSACSGKTAALENCNGQDDDCNGLTDDGPLCDDANACTVGDACLSGICKVGVAKVCDDQNDCTQDSCDKGGGVCVYAPVDGKLCSDGNPCTAGEKCQGGVCAGGSPQPCPCSQTSDCANQEDGNLCNGSLYCDVTSKLCTINPASLVNCGQDDNPCSDAVCQPTTGKCAVINLPDTTTCSDGVLWTVGDNCQKGQCVAGAETKLCKADTDCANYEDGDLCNGTLFCNKAIGVCQVQPKTVVYCPTAADTACVKNTCLKATGQCAMVGLSDQTPCDDGNLCTIGEACQKGICAAANTTGCLCSSNADCLAYEDGDLCNGKLFCNLAKGKCEVNAATVVACQTGLDTLCSQTVCAKASGKCTKVNSLATTPCDADGSPCTPNDHCESGACVAGTSLCQCQTDGDCATLNDADLCNGTLYCNKALGKCVPNPATIIACASGADTACAKAVCEPATGKCKVATLLDCADSDPCTDDACASSGGCQHTPNTGAACNDGIACTSGDQCTAGKCTPAMSNCGCQSNSECTAQEDGDLCNGTLFCDKAKAPAACVVDPKTVVVCNKGNDGPCQTNTCAAKTGVCAPTVVADGTACDDGLPCTTGDKCKAGTCAPTANNCGCQSASDCAILEDGNVCNGTLMCDKTTTPAECKVNPASIVVCSKVNDGPCQTNTCDPTTGKCAPVKAADLTACDADGSVCTNKDNCINGICSAGAALVCDDKNACTKDSCHPTTGCQFANSTDPCNADDNACTTQDSCASGKCVAGQLATCDDNEPCTKDTCKPTDGTCSFAPQTMSCSDGNLCTVGDTCSSGKCAPGGPQNCDDGNACTTDSCDGVKGCQYPVDSNYAVPCYAGPDGTAGKGICKQGSKKCDGSGKLTACQGEILPAGSEACNGLDDNCDGLTDEICPNAVGCMPGSGGACGGGAGVCTDGHCISTDAKGHKWTLVPAGPFWMGCNAVTDPQCKFDGAENPQHQVDLSAYWIGVYEVTAATYQACVNAGASGCIEPTTKGGVGFSTYGLSGAEQKPINYISWNHAKAVCTWLGGDLPTEAQWEKAARGGCETFAGGDCKSSEPKYPWGNTDPTCGEHAHFSAGGGFGCGTKLLAVVGTGSAQGKSPYGAYDMAGNVWEWVLDYLDNIFYAKLEATAKDPWNSTVGSNITVRRGGSYGSSSLAEMRTSYRYGGAPDNKYQDVGVRCAKPYP